MLLGGIVIRGAAVRERGGEGEGEGERERERERESGTVRCRGKLGLWSILDGLLGMVPVCVASQAEGSSHYS